MCFHSPNLETDTYKKIVISKKIEIYKIAGWGPNTGVRVQLICNGFKKPSKSMETKIFLYINQCISINYMSKVGENSLCVKHVLSFT